MYESGTQSGANQSLTGDSSRPLQSAGCLSLVGGPLMRLRSCIHSHLAKALQRASPLRLPPLHSTLRGSLACYLVSDLASLWNLGRLCWRPLDREHPLVHPLKVRHIITVRLIESLWSCQPHLAMHHRRPLLLLRQPQKRDALPRGRDTNPACISKGRPFS